MNTLSFEVGTIKDHVPSDVIHPIVDDQRRTVHNQSSLDVLIALHACDTATDDALWSGIARQATIIVVAPCCHREVRSQLDRHIRQNPNHPMVDILRHAIYRERISETITDSLRALLLEMAGYNVQVFEFIGGEHTSKNVMITAIRRNTNHSHSALANIRERLQAMASLYGVQEHRLARWMKVPLDNGNNGSSMMKVVLSKRMPPLQ